MSEPSESQRTTADDRDVRAARWSAAETARRERQAEYERAERAAACWRAFNAPHRHKSEADAPHGWPKWDAFRKALDAPGAIVALLGNRGTGKTQMAVRAARLACAAGQSAAYWTIADAYDAIKATFGEDGKGTEREVIARLASPDLLILDELQERRASEWEAMTLTRIIDRRYGLARGATVLIGNLLPDRFLESVGPSVASRMSEVGTMIVCNWESFRGRSETGESR